MTPRARRIALLVSCVAPLTLLADARADDEATTYFKVIVDEAPVRSGAHHSFYPFTTVQAGDIVEVTGEREGWARVLTAGPAFDDAVGYVKYSTARTDRIRMLEDGDFAMTLGLTAIIAPNLNSPDPAESWRTIHRAPHTLKDTGQTSSRMTILLSEAMGPIHANLGGNTQEQD